MKRFILIAAVFGFANSEAMLANCMKNFSSNIGQMALQAFGRNFAQTAAQNQTLPKNNETPPINETKALPQQNNGDQNVKKLVVEVTLDPKYNPLLRRFWLMAEAMTVRRLSERESNYYPSKEAWPLQYEHDNIKTEYPYLRDVIELFEESYKKKHS